MDQEMQKSEILERMQAHIEFHQGSDAINLIWKGYLAALMELGLLKAEDYHDLNEVLSKVGEIERREIFLGYPGQYE
jgi:hypothetical protein